MSKPKLALYWAASCGGCEVAVLDVAEKILDVAGFFDIVFWPCAMDFKYKDVEAMADGDIDLCLFNGAIRNSENESMAHLLRRKAKVLVAFGSCAVDGCIPGLANLTTREAILESSYQLTPSTLNPEGTRPLPLVAAPEGELDIPKFYESVRTLAQVVPVDYFIPGCPPQPPQILTVMSAIMQGAVLPPAGSVIGAGEKTCCEECGRPRKEKHLKHFYRVWEIETKPEECLLDQGVICMGPATRSGCGALCVKANMPCRGCYGAAPNVIDQGVKMVSAISSVIDSQDAAEIDSILDQIADPVGTFYRFSVPNSILHRKQPSA
ncbi:MAG: oxidoreductase [Terriglobia bacterium]|jgi:F420-non-reducing hydrogenase small subunit